MYAGDGRSAEQTWTPGRHCASAKKTAVGCVDIQLRDEVDSAPSSSHCCTVNNHDNGRESHHNDLNQHTAADLLDVKPALLADRSPTDGSRIKKSVSFRAESERRRPGGNADVVVDKHGMNAAYRSLPRPSRQQAGHQRPQHSTLNTAAAASSGTAAPNKTSYSRRDWPSVKAVLRDLNDRRDTGSMRWQSRGPGKQSTWTGGGLTAAQADVGVAELFDSSAVDGRHPRSINWFVDLTNVASTEVRPTTSRGTSGLRRYPSHCCRTGASSEPSSNAVNDDKMLEPEPSSRTSWREAAGRRGRPATRSTSDQLRHHDATLGTDIGQRSALRQRTSSPAASRTSELRTGPTGRNPGSEDSVFQRSSASQFHRSATRPKRSEMLMNAAGSAGKPTEPAGRGPTRMRSVSLSEQYRTLLGGDWFDNFATSSAVTNNPDRLTPVCAQHKPLTLSRQLKPDFVIYV